MPQHNTKTWLSNDIVGQYASDVSRYPASVLAHDPLGVKAMRGDGNPAMHHQELLFDAAEGMRDEATGRVIREAPAEQQHYAGEDMRIVPETQALGRLMLEQTEADAWMRMNGYHW